MLTLYICICTCWSVSPNESSVHGHEPFKIWADNSRQEYIKLL